MSRELAPAPDDYGDRLADVKARVLAARRCTALATNAELIQVYWQIGRDTRMRQSREEWGSKGIERMARDLREASPGEREFSTRNLIYMRSFAEPWGDRPIVQQTVAQNIYQLGCE